jgi:hypothetical protein
MDLKGRRLINTKLQTRSVGKLLLFSANTMAMEPNFLSISRQRQMDSPKLNENFQRGEQHNQDKLWNYT